MTEFTDPSDAWKNARPKNSAPRRLPAAFETVRVSTAADELIEAFKQASFACGAAEGPRIEKAYSHLNVTAETLYTYLEQLETLAGVERTIIKRF